MDNLYDYDLDTSAETFEDLPEMVQEDLTAWFNVRKLDNEDDKIRLLDLYQSGRFEAWDCPECPNERVYKGNPDSYNHFQGVLNQDFSFFGNSDKYTEEYLEQMCDSCRCHN